MLGLTLLAAPKTGPEREAFDWKEALIKMLVTFDLENNRWNCRLGREAVRAVRTPIGRAAVGETGTPG